MKAKSKTKSYEELIGELEHIVHQMEQGELPLEDSFRLYQQGILLVEQCQNVLNQIEEQVKIFETNRQSLSPGG